MERDRSVIEQVLLVLDISDDPNRGSLDDKLQVLSDQT